MSSLVSRQDVCILCVVMEAAFGLGCAGDKWRFKFRQHFQLLSIYAELCDEMFEKNRHRILFAVFPSDMED